MKSWEYEKKYYFDLRWYTADLVSYKYIPLWTFFATLFDVPYCMFRRSLSSTSLLILLFIKSTEHCPAHYILLHILIFFIFS